jgi:hypothetical protein
MIHLVMDAVAIAVGMAAFVILIFSLRLLERI